MYAHEEGEMKMFGPSEKHQIAHLLQEQQRIGGDRDFQELGRSFEEQDEVDRDRTLVYEGSCPMIRNMCWWEDV